MINFFFDFLKILSPQQARKLVKIQILLIFMSFFELLSILSIAPFMAIVSNRSLITTNNQISSIYNFFAFEDPNQFLLSLAYTVFAIFALSIFISIYTTWKLLRFSQVVGSEISTTLFKHYLSQDWIFHSQNSTHDFSRKIFEEVKRLTGGIIMPLLQLNNKLILSSVMIIAVFVYNLKVAFFSVTIFGIFYFVLYSLLSKTLYINSNKISDHNKKRFSIIGETFGGIKEIILNNTGDYFYNKFKKENNKFALTQSNNQAIAQLPKFIIELIAVGSVLLLILYLLSYYQSDFSTTITILAVFGLAGIKVLPAFQQIYASIATIKGNISAFYSIHKELIISEKENRKLKKINNKDDYKINLETNILIKNVSYKFLSKKNNALNNISLEIRKSNKIGLVGSTGSGKSTLVDIITGLITPMGGKVLVDNKILNKDNINLWQKNISYVPQNIFLFDTNIIENIIFGSKKEKIDHVFLKKVLKITLIDEFVDIMPENIHAKIGERGIQLSGGQRQRIGIARALYQDNDIIIFDEATNSLDLDTEKKIIASILLEFKNKTIIFISHKPETLEFCDVIYMLNQGSVLCHGSYKNLKNSSKEFERLIINNEDK